MLKKETRVAVTDNSGALEALIFSIYGGTRKTTARVGDIVKVAIKKVIPNGKIKKGIVSKAIVVRTKSPVTAFTGNMAYAGQNAVVLLNETNQPIGTRIFGFVAKKSFLGKGKNIEQMLSMCEEVY